MTGDTLLEGVGQVKRRRIVPFRPLLTYLNEASESARLPCSMTLADSTGVRGTLIKFRNHQISGTGRLDSFIGYQTFEIGGHMLYHGHFTHPELWQMWFAVIGTTVNSILIAYMFYKEKSK